MCVCFVALPTYSASTNGLTLKSGIESLKVIENGTIRKLEYGFLFAFHGNYDRIFSRFDTIHKHDRQTSSHPAMSHRTTA